MRRFAPLLLTSLALHAGVVAVVARRSAESAPPPDEAQGALTGETFDLTEGLKSTPAGGPADEAPPTPAADQPGASRAAPPRPASHAVGTHAPSPGASAASTGSPAPAEYGAVGERSAVDVSVAFTRAFPQAASGDAAWATAPLGDAGEAVVLLALDDAGKLTGTMSGSPSAALRQGVERTLILLGNRPFVSSAPVVALRVHAIVQADEVHDGLHGDVFALGGSYAAGTGSAFFALATGRRVDVSVRADGR